MAGLTGRKVIQIQAVHRPGTGPREPGETELVALCDDGSLWFRYGLTSDSAGNDWAWLRMPGPPND
jgi:hypothetical protein